MYQPAKYVKSGANPEHSFPPSLSALHTRNWDPRVPVPLAHKSYSLGKQPSVSNRSKQEQKLKETTCEPRVTKTLNNTIANHVKKVKPCWWFYLAR